MIAKTEEKPRVVFIEGLKVNLRPFSKDDISIVTRWMNSPYVMEFIGSVLPKTEKQEEDWFNKLGSDDKNVILCIETKDDHPIGIMGIHRIDWVNRNCATGAVIGEKEFWGKGYGTDAKMHLLKYAFETLNLNRVGSSVIEFNKRSLNYSLRCGYQVEGRKRQYIWRYGKYWDLIELGVLREDWQKAWEEFQEKMKGSEK